MTQAGVDIGIARAAAAYTARRRELGIKQRELERLKLISASSLRAFEKGRTWPRERTLAKLEELVQWPAGTIGAIRRGGDVPGGESAPAESTPTPEEAAPLVELVDVALTTIDVALRDLPQVDDGRFAERSAAVLADLRRLEGIAARALRHTGGAPAVAVALSRIRRRYHELMLRTAASPQADMSQRLYESRRFAQLSVAEAAAALGVPAAMVAAIEAGAPPRADVANRIDALIAELAAAN